MADPHVPDEPRETLSRRSFLKGAGGAAAAGGALSRGLIAAQEDGGVETLSGESEVTLRINGADVTFRAEPRTTLLSALRHRIQPPMTGTKEVCDQGNCGACTVMVDGRVAYSCMLLAVDLRGRELRTIEGLGTPDNMSPVQKAFCKHDASMCGFCTPGFVVAMTACLEQNPKADGEEVRYQLSGNLCRCGTYPHIFDAAETAGLELQGEKR